MSSSKNNFLWRQQIECSFLRIARWAKTNWVSASKCILIWEVHSFSRRDPLQYAANSETETRLFTRIDERESLSEAQAQAVCWAVDYMKPVVGVLGIAKKNRYMTCLHRSDARMPTVLVHAPVILLLLDAGKFYMHFALHPMRWCRQKSELHPNARVGPE